MKGRVRAMLCFDSAQENVNTLRDQATRRDIVRPVTCVRFEESFCGEMQDLQQEILR